MVDVKLGPEGKTDEMQWGRGDSLDDLADIVRELYGRVAALEGRFEAHVHPIAGDDIEMTGTPVWALISSTADSAPAFTTSRKPDNIGNTEAIPIVVGGQYRTECGVRAVAVKALPGGRVAVWVDIAGGYIWEYEGDGSANLHRDWHIIGPWEGA
jgi:hypothetical protein